MPDVVAYPHDLSAGKVETGMYWGLTGKTVLPNWWTLDQWETLDGISEDNAKVCPLVSTHALVHKSM